MNRKTVISLCLLIISPVLIYLLWPSDVHRIKKLVRKGAEAVEQKRLDEVMSKVSFNYSDEHGLSYIIIKDVFARVFSQFNAIRVEYEVKNITIRENSATAQLALRVIASHGQDTGYVIGDAAQAASITLSLEKEQTRWLVTKASGMPLPL